MIIKKAVFALTIASLTLLGVRPLPAQSAPTTTTTVNPGGTVSSPPSTTPSVGPPTVFGINPNNGPAGGLVMIFGDRFSANASQDSVNFNGSNATIQLATPHILAVTVPANATSGPVTVTVNGASSNSVAFTVATTSAPTIASISPNAGVPGTPVVITGTGLGSFWNTFYGPPGAPVPIAQPLTGLNPGGPMIPAGSTPGSPPIGAPPSTGGGQPPGGSGAAGGGTSSGGPGAAGGGSGSSGSGSVGPGIPTPIGPGFGVNSFVLFGTTQAPFASFTGTQVFTVVPPGIAAGQVTVTVVLNGVTSNGVAFTVQAPAPPVLSNLSPTSGPIGTIVTITGTGLFQPFFGGGFDVSFNGTSCGWQNIVGFGQGSITCLVPPGATTGNVVVNVGGMASNGLAFTVTPAGPPVLATVDATRLGFGGVVGGGGAPGQPPGVPTPLPPIIAQPAPAPPSTGPGQPGPTPLPPVPVGPLVQLKLTGTGLGNWGNPPVILVNGTNVLGAASFGALNFVSDTEVDAIVSLPTSSTTTTNTVQVQVSGTSSNTLSFTVK